MPAVNRRVAGLVVLAALAAGVELSAHRRDELLQAARIAIDPDRVEIQIDLTPGIAIADAFLAAIDRDRDGLLSQQEQAPFVGELIAAITAEVDGHVLDLRPVASTFPEVDAIRRGEGTIHLRTVAAVPALAAGEHHLSFVNAFRPDGSVYLANALVPESDRIAIAGQHRDTEQRDLTIDYALHPVHSQALFEWLSGLGGAAACGTVLFLRPRRRAMHRGRLS